MERLKEAF
jgi:hypothetical protein